MEVNELTSGGDQVSYSVMNYEISDTLLLHVQQIANETEIVHSL